ncbi:putative ribonuclease H-like domain-containing protein [Tanacetum coccineum]
MMSFSRLFFSVTLIASSSSKSSSTKGGVLEGGGVSSNVTLSDSLTFLVCLFRMIIQQYLQHEYYALWEVIEFGDSYKVPPGKKQGKHSSRRSLMQRERKDYSANLILPKNSGKAILKTFGGMKPQKDDEESVEATHMATSRCKATQSSGSQIKYKDITQIDEDDIEEMEHQMELGFAEHEGCVDIDGIGWDWSYMANEDENHALVADDAVPTEFALMAMSSSSSSSDNEYSVVPSPPAQVYSPPKKDLSWTGLPEFVDDTVTDYTRPTPSVMATLMIKDIGTVVHMTSNISYLSKYELYDRGYVSFGHGGGKITGKGTIKTGKLEFENVYFVKELKYNLFSVSQICDNKNSVLFTDSECLVLGKDFKVDDSHVLLRTPRQHNMYSIDLNNIVPHKNLTCLIAKASVDESMMWHRRLGHLNFKTMNKLVRNNLVRGLPSKSFENDHTCVACLKGKQHKASCKTKLVNSVSKPLHTLHMDLFGPTSVSSLNHKWYCLVVTDDFSRFTWTFFLKSKDETGSILRNLITEIENLKDLKVKIIRCDNGGEFKNREMDEFCTKKGIKREFSNARTPQQNGVAERRNRTLIEAARTMLADAKLPVTFWAEAVSTACYVQNRVLVNKSQNKTPYELFNGRSPAIGFLRPFGCHVMILNTLDHLGKFDAKGDEGYFVGYSLSSKAFRVFNKRTKKVEENLHVDFLENKPIEKGAGPNWLFDIDSLTNSMNYVPVVVAGTSSTNISGTKEDANQAVKDNVSSLRFIALPNWFHDAHMETSNDSVRNSEANDDPQKEQDGTADVSESSGNTNPTASSKDSLADQVEPVLSPTVESKVPTVSSPVPTVSTFYHTP